MHTKDMLYYPSTGELENVVTIRSSLPIYNTRIKIYTSGQVQIRKYKSPLTNQSGQSEKKDILSLKREWLQCYLDEYKKIQTPIKTSQMLKLESQISNLRQDILDHTRRLEEKKQLKEAIKKDSSLKEIRKDSLARTRTTIVDFATEHKFEWKSFVTLTFAENVTDISQANKSFQNYIDQCQRYCRKNGKDFLYLGVPEFQKRGAVHYHFLCNIDCDSFLFPKQMPLKKVYSKKQRKFFTCYNCHYWNHGWSSVRDFNEADENFDPVAYMVKYLYKDLDTRLWGHKKVLRSLKLRKVQELKTIDSTPQILDLEQYLEKNCTKKEFDFEPDQDSFQIPFSNTDYSLIDTSNSNIDTYNLIVSDICKMDKYQQELLPF